MFFLYSLIATVVALLASPVLLVKRRARFGVGQKLGVVPPHLKLKYAREANQGGNPVWFHCVSVGEFNAGYPLIRALHERYPDLNLVISTTTGTGQELARERAGQWADVIYFPYDLPFATARWLETLKPALVVIVETELWPGFTKMCRDRSVALAVVNGRMSPRSFKSYYRWRFFFSKVLACFDFIGVQSEQEAERYRAIGGAELPVAVLGNLKFDGLKPVADADVSDLREKTGITHENLVVVAGSTHEGEEIALIKALESEAVPGCVLVLVPRHPERFDRVAELITGQGLRPRRFSRGEKWEQPGDVYLLDAIGQLMAFYSLADVAFVGGTLAPIGGHNIAEPCAYGIPVVTGSHLHKTRDVADALVRAGALTVVSDADELSAALTELLGSSARRREQGAAGRSWLTESLGAVQRALLKIEALPAFAQVRESAGKAVSEAGADKDSSRLISVAREEKP